MKSFIFILILNFSFSPDLEDIKDNLRILEDEDDSSLDQVEYRIMEVV